ncbi:primase-helicase family protein [Leisingera sp. S232]|uniref:primase-helicase family protein n=1 Tax=Leisingera sp. S232 TaxID=3415132 RepID=UPI003C7D7AA4
MANKKPTVPTTEDIQHVKFLAATYGNQIVRRDNKFYDIEHLGTPLSRVDVEMKILNLIAEEHPNLPLNTGIIKSLFKLLIDTRHTDRARSFQVWSGATICEPGNPNRIVMKRGTVSADTWSEPEYRSLKVNSADLDVVGEFFDQFVQNEQDRGAFLNWTAWSLQNEGDKPAWAPFLYSRGKGTGKSTTARILIELFGVRNSVTQNNISKLTQQFNATVLTSKLVICEETQIKPGSTQANAIKTFITDPHVLIERKDLEAERAKQCCCFLFTSNYAPTWMEEGERRYLVIDVNHDGRSGGLRANEFSSLVGRVHEFLDEPANVARLYNALMQGELPEGFNAKSLNIADHQTPIMKRLQQASRQTIVDQLGELLNASGLVVLPEADVVEFVRKNLNANMNQPKHLMDDLEWEKTKVKWGGKDFARAIWVKPGYWIERGKIYGPDFEPVRVSDYLDRDGPFGEVEIIE